MLDMLTRQLANHLKRTVTGPMWHGPSLNDVLSGVSHDSAAARSIADAHSIWELVLHITVWADVARARLAGERLADLTPDEDWPAVGETTPLAWTTALDRMRESYRTLADEVRQLDDARLQDQIAGADYTVSVLLHGAIEHGTYHAGQIAILKRALGRN
jgi:uncharacterized damage-inducible protein DinB